MASTVLFGLFETITLSRPYIESGKLVPLAVTGPKRSAYLPDVPTLIESNVNVQTSGWTAIVAPKDTPTGILPRIQQELRKGLEDAGIRNKLGDMCAEPIVNSPADFERDWEQEEQMWSGVIRKAGIELN